MRSSNFLTHGIFYIDILYLLTLVGGVSSDVSRSSAQLLLCHDVRSSVSLTFSSKDALVHFLVLSMYCILVHPLLLFPDIIPRMHIIFFHSFIAHCCGLQMSHVSFSFLQLSLSDRIVSSQSCLLDCRPMFVLVSLFLVCLPVFLLLLSAECHNVLMCFSLCGPHMTTFCFSGCFYIVVSFTPIFCSTSMFVV